MKKLNIIDMGSNAVRYVLGAWTKNLYHEEHYKRVPYSLNDIKSIDKAEINFFVNIFKKMKIAYCNEYPFKSVMTGHFRELNNVNILQKLIYSETGILLELLSGEEEARLIAETVLTHVKFKSFIHADLGGASLEINEVQENQIIYSKSNNIGILKVMKLLAKNNESDFKEIANKQIKGLKKSPLLVLTGGNSNFIADQLKLKNAREVKTSDFYKIYQDILSSSITERMKKYKIKEERARKLTASLAIFDYLISELNTEIIVFPRTGLREALMLNYLKSENE